MHLKETQNHFQCWVHKTWPMHTLTVSLIPHKKSLDWSLRTTAQCQTCSSTVWARVCACSWLMSLQQRIRLFFHLARSILTVSGEWVELTRLNDIQVMEAAACLPPAAREGHKRVRGDRQRSINPIGWLTWTRLSCINTDVEKNSCVFNLLPFAGEGSYKRKLLFRVTGRQPGNAPQWEKTGCGCGLLGVSLIVKE